MLPLPTLNRNYLIHLDEEEFGRRSVNVPSTKLDFIAEWVRLLFRLDNIARDPDANHSVRARVLREIGICMKEIQTLMEQHSKEENKEEAISIEEMVQKSPDKARELIMSHMSELNRLLCMIELNGNEDTKNGDGDGSNGESVATANALIKRSAPKPVLRQHEVDEPEDDDESESDDDDSSESNASLNADEW
jgi:DNA-binding transcriptional MerR regulator